MKIDRVFLCLRELNKAATSCIVRHFFSVILQLVFRHIAVCTYYVQYDIAMVGLEKKAKTLQDVLGTPIACMSYY